MPFVTKKPSHYFAALEEGESAEPLHIGLLLAGGVTDGERADDLVSLGRAVRRSSRRVRRLWLRFKGGGDDGVVRSALTAFGDELAGAATVQSLVFEGAVGTDEVSCLGGFFANCSLRELQFRRTNVDASTFVVMAPFFQGSTTLKVLDMSSNPDVNDECIDVILNSFGTRLETLSIGESNIDGQQEGSSKISGRGVFSIASFISKSEWPAQTS